MPLTYAFDADLGMLAVRYAGLVRAQDVVAAIPDMGELARQSPSYAVLLLFDDKVDLSRIDADGLRQIKQAEQDAYRRLNLRRRASAAVITRSADAKMLLPLWNALSEIDTEPGFRYQTFHQPDAAFDWLGVDRNRGQELVSRTVPDGA